MKYTEITNDLLSRCHIVINKASNQDFMESDSSCWICDSKEKVALFDIFHAYGRLSGKCKKIEDNVCLCGKCVEMASA